MNNEQSETQGAEKSKGDLIVETSDEKSGEIEKVDVNKISQGAAIRLIGKIATIHHIDVRLKLRGIGA